jgi:hypothetical protein
VGEFERVQVTVCSSDTQGGLLPSSKCTAVKAINSLPTSLVRMTPILNWCPDNWHAEQKTTPVLDADVRAGEGGGRMTSR